MKRFLSFLLASSVLSTFMIAPAIVLADCKDDDNDRYYACTDPENDQLSPFAKGMEETRCDEIDIGEEFDSVEWDLVAAPGTKVKGNRVHPGAIEAPDSDVDYDCDGEIKGILPEGKAGNTDLFGMVENIIVLIGQAAVFISVGALIYGGIMFATASGEEGKIQKAKKTIIGAVVGLIIGLIAWNIVGFVTDTFGG